MAQSWHGAPAPVPDFATDNEHNLFILFYFRHI